MKKIFITGLVALFAFATLGLTSGTALAASASMSIAGSSHTVGETFSAAVYENGGDGQTINTVDAYFTISDKSKLQVTGVSYSGTFEKASPAPACTADFCVLAGVIGNGLAGSQLVAVVNFKALAAGNVTVSFNGNSRIVSGTTNTEVPSTKSNATYAITAPVATPPANNTNPTAPNSNKKAVTPTKAATTTGSTNNTTSTSNGEVEGDATTTATTDDKKKDNKSDDKKSDDKKDTTKNASSKAGLGWSILAVIAVVAGFVFGRRYVQAKAAAQARADAAAAAVAASQKKATKKAQAKGKSKTQTKKPKK